MVDEPLEDGMCPWGSAAILLKHHRNIVEVIPMSLAICSALGLFFSEKFARHRQARGHGVDAHVKPEFGTCGFNDAQARSVNGSDTARGRLAIFQGPGTDMFCSTCTVSPAWRATRAMWSCTRSCRFV